MNIEQFCADYRATVESLPRMLESVTVELRESFGYSLEEILLWRQEAVANADVVALRNIQAIDQRLAGMAMAVRERLGVDVRRYLDAGQFVGNRSGAGLSA